MNSPFSQASLAPQLCKFLPCPLRRPLHICPPYEPLHKIRTSSHSSPFPSKPYPSLHVSSKQHASASAASDEGAVAMINFEDLIDKDFSFLDSDNFSSRQEHEQKISRIISAGEIAGSSKVMTSIPSEGFVDQLFESAPCQSLLVVHDSIISLACIKEKYDKVKCWQGEVVYVPEKWAPFDAVFLYYLPAIALKLNEVFEALSRLCLPGARLVISHPQGREVLEQERQQFPDVVVSDLPDKMTLQKVAVDHSFDLTEFRDEPGFYLAVLKSRRV